MKKLHQVCYIAMYVKIEWNHFMVTEVDPNFIEKRASNLCGIGCINYNHKYVMNVQKILCQIKVQIWKLIFKWILLYKHI